MALTLTHIVLVFLLVNAISSHILIGRDVTQRKVFRTKSGAEFIISRPLTKGQKLMIARELLKDSAIDLVIKFARNNKYHWITQQCTRKEWQNYTGRKIWDSSPIRAAMFNLVKSNRVELWFRKCAGFAFWIFLEHFLISFI